MKNIISIICLALVFTGCEKVIDVNYKDNESKIVIEGNITNEPGPYYVKISKSVPLSSSASYPLINDAVVTINDNAGNTETLVAEGNGLYRTNIINGVEGRTYTLNVTAENKTYTAQSTMPQRVPFDSIKIEELKFTNEITYNFIPVYFDPVAKGNYYRFQMLLNGKRINQHFVQNDEVRNGTVNVWGLEIDDEDLDLKSGDLVTLTMQCIDSVAGKYYTTLAMIGNSGPGGGTTPANPPTNITNGALGLFSAHTLEAKSKVLP